MPDHTIVHADNAEAWLKQRAQRSYHIAEAGHGLEIVRDLTRDVAKHLDQAGDQGITLHRVRQLILEIEEAQQALVAGETVRKDLEKQDDEWERGERGE